ncbi:Longitudinals lacking protein, isoforms H/M/V [Chionoecetes opilio]|uniref:Longitudinals lacking protein, isoforms H/M/V n=1 Tax=Chionoecetes opilio TaxID=41210 RepID=A0A8J4XMH6_CHIOP|nr:Longitudinals lacking protein, isoforms H/M/V [Chionoecetes opilio]
MCREDPLPHPALLMMGSDQYCLKWNNHWANLIRVFNSLLQSETFVDVTLACEGRHLKAHRLVLSACSPYFKELLVAHPDKHPIVILKDVRYSELRTLIEFIYNGEVSVEQNDLAALLCTARELQIKGLADNRLPGAPSPHCTGRDVGEGGKYTLTPTSTAGLPTATTTCSTSPPLEAAHLKGGSPRRKGGSEDRPPPPLTALHPGMPPSTFCSTHLSAYPYHSHPTSREASPVHKRRRVSVEGCEEDGEAGEGRKQAQSDPPNGHFPHHPDSHDRQYTLTSNASGIRLIDPTRREVSWETPKELF